MTLTESGLQFSVLEQGNGPIPSRQDRVRVHYTGRLINGDVFDSSVERGQPAEFPVSGVIPCWIEALTLMPVGSKWQLYIPHNPPMASVALARPSRRSARWCSTSSCWKSCNPTEDCSGRLRGALIYAPRSAREQQVVFRADVLHQIADELVDAGVQRSPQAPSGGVTLSVRNFTTPTAHPPRHVHAPSPRSVRRPAAHALFDQDLFLFHHVILQMRIRFSCFANPRGQLGLSPCTRSTFSAISTSSASCSRCR